MQYPSLERLTSTVVDFFDPEHDNYLWILEEKVDGSQLSFRLENGKIVFYHKAKLCKGGNIFGPAIDSITQKFAGREQLLNPNYTYHGECFSKTKHNVIEYTRFPRNFWICYDIFDSKQNSYLERDLKENECKSVDLECVQLIYRNLDRSVNPHLIAKDYISKFENMEILSSLGGMIEGVVLKHHRFFTRGEFSSRKRKMTTTIFKEKQKKGTRYLKKTSTAQDFIDAVSEAYNTNARFAKSIIHLKEDDMWDDNNMDSNLSAMVEELDKDFEKEYKREVREYLCARFLNDIIKRYEKQEANEEDENAQVLVTDIAFVPDSRSEPAVPDVTAAFIEEVSVVEKPRFVRERDEFSDLDDLIGTPKPYQSRKFYNAHQEEIKDWLWERYSAQIKKGARRSLEAYYYKSLVQ